MNKIKVFLGGVYLDECLMVTKIYHYLATIK